MSKIGICISLFLGLSLARLAEFGREAENAGIAGIFIPEGRNDGLMCCYVIAQATHRITVATWIVNIFLREPAVCSSGILKSKRQGDSEYENCMHRAISACARI